MSRVKTYNKYYVKRSIDGKTAHKNEDGSPVLGDIHKTKLRLTPEQAEELNFGWDSPEKPLSFFCKEVEEEETKTEERIALELEAEELGIKFRSNISDEKLQEKINEVKQ
ncbi:MAG: hypothetical protein ACOWWH_12620 [Eubacteriaceae bacterium]